MVVKNRGRVGYYRGVVDAAMAVHKMMRWIHWPLYLLTIASPFLIWIRWRAGEPDAQMFFYVPPAMVFVYFAVLLTILAPLPRYAIPVRPFAYVLAVCGLFQTIYLGRLMIPRLKRFVIPSESALNGSRRGPRP